MKYETLYFDILIIGGGGAGCMAANKAGEKGNSVLLVNNGPLNRSGITLTAGGSYQAPLHPNDSPRLFREDIIKAGRGLTDENLVNVYVKNAKKSVLDIEKLRKGTFMKSPDRSFTLYSRPGQTVPRSLSSIGGGLGIQRTLVSGIVRKENVKVMEDAIITRLLTNNNEVVGGTIWNIRKGKFYAVAAKSTILATGGWQAIWQLRPGDCPPTALGDGQSMAYHVGASLVDMEMILFYPTVAIWPPTIQGTPFLYEFIDNGVTEITNADGENIIKKDPTPLRDEACEIIYREMLEGKATPHGGVYYDVPAGTASKDIKREHFSKKNFAREIWSNRERLQKIANIDILEERIEVAPSAHYVLGGVRINEICETDVRGLYATTECAGNFEGANRMSGTALSGCIVFGAIAGISAAERAIKTSDVNIKEEQIKNEYERIMAFFKHKNDELRAIDIIREIQYIMSKYVGRYGRNEEGLKTALESIQNLKKNFVPRIYVPNIKIFNVELSHALQVSVALDAAEFTTEAARLRTESRGHHSRTDYPNKDDENWLNHTIIRKRKGDLETSTAPVIKDPFQERRGTWTR